MSKVTTRNRNKNKLDKNGKPKKPNWEYRFEMASVDGRRKQASKSGFTTQKEAEKAGTKALAEYLNGGVFKTSSNMSVSDFLDMWLREYVNVNLRPSTQESYRHIIECHLKPSIGHYKLQSIDAMTLQRFMNSYKEKEFSRNRVRSIRSTLKTALDYAVEPARYLQQNPMLYVKTPAITTRKLVNHRNVVSVDEWQRIIERYPFGHKYHVPLMIGYHTGLRRGEVLGLTWDDIDLENGIIHVRKQQSKLRDSKMRWCIAPLKTKSSMRSVKMGFTLHETLKRERIRQKENRLKYGEYFKRYRFEHIKDEIYEIIDDPNGNIHPVCIWDHGQFINRDTFNRCIRAIREKLGIELDFHSLRHSHATILSENGVNPKSLQMRLGHGDIQTTLRNYVHETDKMASETIDIFERATRGQI